MTETVSSKSEARHARLFELIRQQNIAAARVEQSKAAMGDLNDAQAFIEAARATLQSAA